MRAGAKEEQEQLGGDAVDENAFGRCQDRLWCSLSLCFLCYVTADALLQHPQGRAWQTEQIEQIEHHVCAPNWRLGLAVAPCVVVLTLVD